MNLSLQKTLRHARWLRNRSGWKKTQWEPVLMRGWYERYIVPGPERYWGPGGWKEPTHYTFFRSQSPKLLVYMLVVSITN